MPNSTTPKLTDTQLVILSSASQRDDGLAILPEKLKGGAAKATVLSGSDRGSWSCGASEFPGEPDEHP